ncbi:MAG: hypothetical protein JWO03_3415 [Bacteroidetes bacterium]|nr:hypothetical protein [Bacteroidota bacterium]
MNNTDLKTLWDKVSTSVNSVPSDEWQRIEAAYSASGRHYHTLQHLCEVYINLDEYYKGGVPISSIYALFYHDLVYNTLRSDNEKISADHARTSLRTQGADEAIIEKTACIILATADHDSRDEETMIFLDADMAILGSDEKAYHDYTGKVRKEFSIYPDLLYKRGRRKFVDATLKRDRIFLTVAFQNKYENRARINLTNELNLLQ